MQNDLSARAVMVDVVPKQNAQESPRFVFGPHNGQKPLCSCLEHSSDMKRAICLRPSLLEQTGENWKPNDLLFQ